MTPEEQRSVRRADRLVRVYPREWRARYGDEFAQLLLDQMADDPRSWRRTADVVRGGLLARAAAAGLRGDALDPARQLRASLAAVGFALVVFAAAGVGIWSQLTVDWQWSSPADPGTTAAMFVMSGALAVLSVLAVLAALPVASSLAKAFARDGGSHLTRPLALVAVGLAVLIAGSIHFGHGWPGTGGHPWADHGLVPGFVARFCWAATLWITSYWAHPGALSAFPAAEIGWMAVSPFALAAVVVGAGQLVRRLRLGPRALRYETWLGRAAGVTMAAFFAGAASWVVSSAPGPRLLFRVGAIDGVALAVMAGAVLVAFRALGRVPPKHGRPAG